MSPSSSNFNRRSFLKRSSLVALGTGALIAWPETANGQSATTMIDLNIVGPKEGFSPQIGTLVSMMNWMRHIILMPVNGMSISELDYLIDDKANSIGAMLWHLAATERFYQIHCFEGRKWGDWEDEDKEKWLVASRLGDAARGTIKGNPMEFYLEKLETVREHTLNEFAKRDDEWLMEVDDDWFWGPTNNYCKWFHVCEHESNHNGQFKLIKSRIPE